MELDFEKAMEHIVASIQTAGFDPYAQLYGYMKTGDSTYITRNGDARNLIKTLDQSRVRNFVNNLAATKR